MTVYQDVNSQQVLLENHVTGDILLTLPGQSMRYFANKVEFIIFFLQDLGLDSHQLIFNTLATPFLVSSIIQISLAQMFWFGRNLSMIPFQAICS